jgi:cell division protease FtsH
MQERMMGGGGAGGIFGFAKSRAKRFDKGQSSVTFDDVAGLDNAKRDLREISDYLRDPQPYRKLGAKIPRGVLLMGPPGTGKTLLARAVAGEANVPFFSISASEFIEMFVGVGASRVRDMFQSAKKEAPAIIFIDEIDSIGRARGTGLGGGHDEREQTLNQILNEMDGFEPHEAVVVLAATNRPDVLDAALMRPGRFDRKVTLDLPDRKARQAILKIHSRAVPLAGDVDLVRLAALTVGFSGADLENLINEAALLAGRKGSSEVDMALMLEARDKVVLGGLREMLLSDDEKQLVAFHEAGHAVVASLLPHADPLDKVTIIPRGRALGVTEQIPETEQHNFKQSYLHDRIGVMLGGRCSEKLIFGEVSSGAEEDLKQATLLARHMVTHWGMSEKIGPVAFHRGEEHIFLGREMAQQRDFSEHTAEVIDDEVSQLLKHREVEIAQLLKSNRALLEAVAKALLEKETLEADEVRALVDACPKAVRGTGK